MRTLTLERDAAVASSQVTAEADQDRAATDPQGDQREHRESASQTVEAPRPAGPETFARRALLDALTRGNGGARGGGGGGGGRLLEVEPRLRLAIKAFRKRCADLTSGPACNNICS